MDYSHGVQINSFHADNGIYAEKAFDEVAESGQTMSFCRVGAYHQNGIAEDHVEKLTQWSYTNFHRTQ